MKIIYNTAIQDLLYKAPDTLTQIIIIRLVQKVYNIYRQENANTNKKRRDILQAIKYNFSFYSLDYNKEILQGVNSQYKKDNKKNIDKAILFINEHTGAKITRNGAELRVKGTGLARLYDEKKAYIINISERILKPPTNKNDIKLYIKLIAQKTTGDRTRKHKQNNNIILIDEQGEKFYKIKLDRLQAVNRQGNQRTGRTIKIINTALTRLQRREILTTFNYKSSIDIIQPDEIERVKWAKLEDYTLYYKIKE